MYQALYRKWRPKTFDEVVGQTHITDTLKSELRSGRLSHAYLFTGTRGTGKTTCAKIFARAVNCLSPADGEPCNACEACVGIENGSIMDVVELDAASNNGVDQVRALRDEAVFTPAAAKKRVYIVDEVHMLSNAAFNALLKIMEEPPAHLIFILATTEAHKVPATILSRCQRFAFKRVSQQDIASRAAYVAQQEGLALTDDAVSLLSRLADGSVRDSLSLLDQCAAGAGGAVIDARRVLDVLGLAGTERSIELLARIARRDTAGAMSLFGQLYDAGKDPASVLDELSSLLRDIMYMLAVPGAETLHGEALRPFFEQFPISRVVFSLDRISAVLNRSPRRLDAETCLLTLCDETLSLEPEAISARLERLENRFVPPQAPKAAPAPPGGAAMPPEAAPFEAPLPSPAESGALWAGLLSGLHGNITPAEYVTLSDASKVVPTVTAEGVVLKCRDAFVLRMVNRQHMKDAVAAVYRSVTGSDCRFIKII